MSELFANRINCKKDINGFFQLSCICGDCSDCKISKPFSRDDMKDEDVIFNQYVVETFVYKTRKGVEREGKRTVRKTFEKFQEFEEKLLSLGKSYLLHGVECINDVYHWPIIKSNGLGYTFHMYYSENISSTPEFFRKTAFFALHSVV